MALNAKAVEMNTVPTTRAFLFSLAIICGGPGFPINAIGQSGLGTEVRTLQEKIWTAERGTPEKAVAAMREAVEQFKTSSTAWYYYGVALTRAGDLAGARDAFRKTLKLEPNFVQARLRLAQTLLLAGQSGEAEKEARRALDSDAKPGDSHYVFGEVHLFAATRLKRWRRLRRPFRPTVRSPRCSC
ncbi:MAG: hypothetical protein DMF60_17605 [Acidobacteria bacterium]|nr:MAG: hypothetical protein DMF60_17605 [Acidobacteriota bacterium]